MKFIASVILTAIAATSYAGAGNSRMAAGHRYYAQAEFGKAASYFQEVCNTDADTDACYWAGLSYEMMEDVSIPLGCRIGAKARRYFSKAVSLAPERTQYRNALFDFLLNNAECSHASLRQAAEILSTVPESDPEYSLMRSRLQNQIRFSRSIDAHAAGLLLVIPHTAERIGRTILPATLTERAH